MTRWKRGHTTTIVRMRSHNCMSHWYGALFLAAQDMGLPVGFRKFENESGDGSTDREWYVSTAWLQRLGGEAELTRRAHTHHRPDSLYPEMDT